MSELHLTLCIYFAWHDSSILKFVSKDIVCVVVEMVEQQEQYVCKVILVISLSLSQAEQLIHS